MTLREKLSKSASFSFENNIFYHNELVRGLEFERNYLEVRQREGRIYPDEIVVKLPDVPADHILFEEWQCRSVAMKNLLRYLNNKKVGSILELGCGNGWLAHHLATIATHEVIGVDINEHELLQGSRVFRNDKNLIFAYGNIFEMEITGLTFDVIILSGSTQYFPDLEKLLARLMQLLEPSGEIHIVDSPWYRSATEVQEAKNNSKDYFRAKGVTEMTNKYHHHSMSILNKYSYRMLHKPNMILEKIKAKIFRSPVSRFPWIVITRD
jgi:ubiquinone/menaquinone biosynthesis C-methylase UbiE